MKTLTKAIAGSVLIIIGFYASAMEFSALSLFMALTGVIAGSVLLAAALTNLILYNDSP